MTDLSWERLFSPTTLERGRQYARTRRVLSLSRLPGEALSLTATVRGSDPRPYQCAAQLFVEAPYGLRLRSSCDCPVGFNCKHVAAMLFAANADVSTLNSSAKSGPLGDWATWLQRLQASTSTSNEPSNDAPHLALLLRAAAYGRPPTMLASLVRLSEGKSGRLIDPSSLQSSRGVPSAEPVGGWRDDHLMAAMTMIERQIERIGKINYAPLEGRAQEHAFSLLSSSLPVYFERTSQPLQPGPDRPLELSWGALDDGSQRLLYGVPGGKASILRITSLWYVDPQQSLFGRVVGNPRLINLCYEAPLLKPEQCAALSTALSDLSVPLPPPAPRSAPRVIRAAPRARLNLRVNHVVDAHYRRTLGDAIGYAELSFAYADEWIGPQEASTTQRWRNGELVEIERDLAAEQVWQQRLSEIGLHRVRQQPYPYDYVLRGLGGDCLVLLRQRQPQPPEAWAEVLEQLNDSMLLQFDADFPRRRREVSVGEWDAELSSAGGHWFELSLGIDIDGERLDLLPILRQVLSDPRFPLQRKRNEPAGACWPVELDDRRSAKLPLARLRDLIAPLIDWLQQEGPLRLHRSQGREVEAISQAVHWRGNQRQRQELLMLDQLPTVSKSPAGFKAKLRPYQQQGLAWLELLGAAGLGGILADDMGLGKTVQVLAHLQARHRASKGRFRALVVAPTSLVGNWCAEAAKFAPALNTLLLHGAARGERFADIDSHCLVVTTYPLLARDRDALLTHEFDLLVLDEAQAVKNAKSQAAQVVRELRAKRRLAMTGTPLENHLGELWAQFDAVEPGLLGSERDFNRHFRTPIEKHADAERQERLNRRVAPLLLRRRKDEVLADLPTKTEIIRQLDLEGDQRSLYETLRLAQHQRVREAVAERGLAQSGIVVLDALLKLRQACCDPRLVKLPAARKVKKSAKLDAVLELLDTLFDEGRRVLLFSQFTGMLDLIEAALKSRKIDHLRLDGSTPGSARAGLVERFQSGKAPLFLISLKAGGVGLNLTAADTVIHYDPWWNPAVEAQATDRAHRIGQDKPVFVYKLICQGTVEEKIVALQARKAELADALLDGGRSTTARFTEADLELLFAPLAGG